MSININKKKLLRLIYILLCILFITYMLCSNILFSTISGSTLHKDSLENFQNNTTNCMAYLDSISIGEDLFQISTLSGWAFGGTNKSNYTRNSKFVFISDKNIYSMDATLSERADVQSVYDSMLPEDSSINLGAMASFSPIVMADGIYELYVYCWENEQDYGLVSTGKKFLKEGRVFKEYTFQSENIENMTAQEDLVCNAVEIVSQNDGMLEIVGWGFIENMDCSQQTVYVKLDNGTESETYTTEQKTRSDVAESYKNEQYAASGYSAEIPLEQLGAGSYQLELFVKNGDTIASAIKGTVQIAEDGGVSYTTAKDIIKTFESEKVENLIAQEDLVYSSVDLVSNNNTMLEIVGWGFIENMDCSQQTVYVKLDNGTESETYTTEQKTRSDVAESYKNEQYAASGYSAEIPLEQLGAGSYQLELFVKNGDTIASAIKGTVQIAEDGTIMYTKA